MLDRFILRIAFHDMRIIYISKNGKNTFFPLVYFILLITFAFIYHFNCVNRLKVIKLMIDTYFSALCEHNMSKFSFSDFVANSEIFSNRKRFVF